MKRLRWGLSFICILTAWLSALAGQKPSPLPTDLPAYGPSQPFHAPNVEVRKLPNGLTLWLVSRPGFPKVALALAARGGMAADPKDLPGLSQLLVATIDQGTKTHNAREIAEELQAAGGDLTSDARADTVLVMTDVLASRTEAALGVLADVCRNATFPAGEVALAKRNAEDNLRAQEADPEFLADRELSKEIFGSHPYSVTSPTEESIGKVQPEELRRVYGRRLRPDQALLVAVGDFASPELEAAVKKYFGTWQAPGQAPVASVPKAAENNPHGAFVVERPDSVQTTFAIAAFGPLERDPDYAAAQVANAIYGGMFGSRLITNIREDKGYTYSPQAFLQSRTEAGILETRADVRNLVTGATLNEINYELNRMATTAPREDEVERARRYLVGLQAIRLQSQESVARQLATLWSFGLPPEELVLESERIQKVTARDVETVGKKYFPASRQTIVAVGEQTVVRKELAPFGLSIHPAAP